MSDGHRDFEGHGKDWTAPLVSQGGKPVSSSTQRREVSTFVSDRRVIFLPPTFPKIVVLCGSTRFKEAYEKAMREETLKGHVVIGVGLFGHQEAMDMEGDAKKRLDALHKDKIYIADEVLVLNCKRRRCSVCQKWWKDPIAGLNSRPDCDCWPEKREDVTYIGDSTRSEIAYAQEQGKVIRYLEEVQ